MLQIEIIKCIYMLHCNRTIELLRKIIRFVRFLNFNVSL